MKVLGIAGYSGSGKTTLIEKIIPLLVRDGLARVAHQARAPCVRGRLPGQGFVAPPAGRLHRGSGELCARWALMHELSRGARATLQEQLARLGPCDLVIVEGWKFDPIPRIEVHRSGADARRPLLFPSDPHVGSRGDRRATGHAASQFASRCRRRRTVHSGRSWPGARPAPARRPAAD